MVPQPQSWRRLSAVLAIAFMTAGAPAALAQEHASSPAVAAVKDVTKRVLFDPTTYAPAILGYDATMRDWRTSQVFFENGFVERNPRFTVNGLPYDTPLGYRAGQHRIAMDALDAFKMSLVHNVTESIIERVLVERYPQQRRLFRVLGWVERGAVGSYTAYRLSNQHYRQARFNEQEAVRLGLQP
jgi:hypothetical protein